MRILIADDEAIIRMGLKSMLQKLGHDVVAVASDGAAAVRQADATRPDLVILDIKMPYMNGLEAAEAIVAKRPVPIVILSAYSDRDLVERAAGLAVHGYLVKPITPEDLSPALEIAVGRFEEWQVLQREAADLQEALEARDRIEEAKRRLMKRQGLSEGEAFRKLQGMARRERRSMRQVADRILGQRS